jgi:hypothetical protein
MSSAVIDRVTNRRVSICPNKTHQSSSSIINSTRSSGQQRKRQMVAGAATAHNSTELFSIIRSHYPSSGIFRLAKGFGNPHSMRKARSASRTAFGLAHANLSKTVDVFQRLRNFRSILIFIKRFTSYTRTKPEVAQKQIICHVVVCNCQKMDAKHLVMYCFVNIIRSCIISHSFCSSLPTIFKNKI